MPRGGEEAPPTRPPLNTPMSTPPDAGNDPPRPPDSSSITQDPPSSKPTPDAGAMSPPPVNNACKSTVRNAIRKRLDMYIVMDANITLTIPGITAPLWDLAASGLTRFVEDPGAQEIGVGLRFFGDECDPGPYDTPNVEVDMLPANEAKLRDELNKRPTYSASPMLPALQGAIQHQVRRAKAQPEYKQIVVMLTDGFTADFACRDYDPSELVSAASAGYNGDISIETHVIGFGLPLIMTNVPIADEILARINPLEQFAKAGGGLLINVPAGSDANTMYDALQRVRRTAQPCEFRTPNYDDPDLVGLSLSEIGEVPRVSGATGCGRLHGWHYDDDKTPKSVVLCPTTCGTLQQDDSMAVWFDVGCPPGRRVTD